MRTTTLALLAGLALAPSAHAQYLLVSTTTGDRVLLLDAADGTVLDANYIDVTPGGGSQPFEAAIVGQEIWVCDFTADRLMRFSLDGNTWLGNVIGGLDSPRGMEFVNGEIWVTNSATGGGAPGNAIVRFSPAGANLGFFAVPSPWDVANFQGDVLIADITNDDILRYSTAGASLGVFHASDGVTGIDFPEQVSVRANGNVLCAGFSAPAGIYEYDSTGLQLNYWPVASSVAGVMELGNGKILYTNVSGIHVFDPVAMSSTTLVPSIDARHVARFAGANPPPVPYCFGDGSGTACPCTPVPLVGDADKGCPNSFNAGGGKLAASGNASIGGDTLVMTCTLINNGGAVVFQGTNDNGGGLGTAFGDGLRCAAGTIRRMRSHTVTTNTHEYPDPMFADNAISIRGAVMVPGDRLYQGWYRSGLAHCEPTQNYNLTNAVKITWVP